MEVHKCMSAITVLLPFCLISVAIACTGKCLRNAYNYCTFTIAVTCFRAKVLNNA